MIKVEKDVSEDLDSQISCDCHGKKHKTLYFVATENMYGEHELFLCRSGAFELKRTLHRMLTKSRKK